jgi:hypothetical protein
MFNDDEEFAFQVDTEVLAQAALRVALDEVARDLLSSMDEDSARQVFASALADAGLDLDVDEIFDGLLAGPSFTGSTREDDHGRTTHRQGTLTYADGSRRFVIERVGADGVLHSVLDRPIVGAPTLDAEDLAAVDWATVAVGLQREVRELWPVVEADDELGYPPSPADALDLSRSTTGGPTGLLADVAHTVISWEDTTWDDVDRAITLGVAWAAIIEDPWGDVYRIGKLVQAGFGPDRQALDALRSPPSDDVLEGSGDRGRPQVADVFTALAGETPVSRAARAADELGLSVASVAWAHTGRALGRVAVFDDSIIMWSQYGPLRIDPYSGDVIGEALGWDAPTAYELIRAGEVLLAVHANVLVAYDPSDWSIRWHQPASEGIRVDRTRAMVRDGGSVVADPTSVVCVDLASGAVRWTSHGQGRRPGLWPIGFVGDLALLVRRVESTYHLFALDAQGGEVGSWEVHGDGGRVVGGWVCVGEHYTRIDELLGSGPRWRTGPTPATRDGVVWLDGDDFHPWRVGFGEAEEPAWMAEVPEMTDMDTRPADSGWVHAGGRWWTRSHGWGLLIGVGRGSGDVVTKSLPHMYDTLVQAGPGTLLVHSQGRSGGSWLTCLNADAMGGPSR